MAYIDIILEQQFEDYQDQMRELVIEFKYTNDEISGR